MTITWTERKLPPERDFSWQQIRCSDDGLVILALAYYNLSYLSTDGGVTWTMCDPNPSATMDVLYPSQGFYWCGCAVSGDGNTLMMVANKHFTDPDENSVVQGYFSKDKGGTWSEIVLDESDTGLLLFSCCCDYDGSHML